MKLGSSAVGCFTEMRQKEEGLPQTLDLRIKKETGYVWMQTQRVKALGYASGCGWSWKNGQNYDYLYVWKVVAGLGEESNWENGIEIGK